MLLKLLHFFTLKKDLREYQKKYYAGSKEEESEIVNGYLSTLAETREVYLDLLTRVNRFIPWKKRLLPTGAEVLVHIGCGGNYLKGWINIDVDPQSPADMKADLAKGIPLETGSADYIHTEDFLEHIELEEGKRFLSECFRILKAGGTMRLLTPDLRSLIEKVYLRRSPSDLRWCLAHLKADGPCEALNMHMRMGGAHRFIYDYEQLSRILHDIGFTVRAVSYNVSSTPLLRFLDLRDYGLNLFLECQKQKSHGKNG